MNNKFQARSDKRNKSIENFNLNRGIDVFTKNEKTFEVLNDRDMFNHFSNEYEQIDMTNVKPNENAHGMPLFNPQILNNKKNLINNPYIQESNDQTHFRALNTTSNTGSGSNMYASFGNKEEEDDNASNNSEGGGFSVGKFSGFDKIDDGMKMSKSSKSSSNPNSNSNSNPNSNLMENAVTNLVDTIEKGIIIYEYTLNIGKEKNFMMDINSPFAVAFLWKSLILLSKNPSTDKFLKLLQIKKKDETVNDMKYFSDVFSDMGQIEYLIPYSVGMINTNFTKKLEEIYKIKVKSVEKTNNFDNGTSDNALVTLNFKFELKIPFYYQPEIVIDYLLDFNTNKIKFLKMKNVPCALDIDRQLSTVNMEFPVGDNMILGFLYNLSRKNISDPELLYTKINQKREINKVVKDLYIPKINRHKKINYGKKFIDDLKQVHLGEIIYGNMYDIDIISNMELEITIDKIASNNKYQITSNIDEIKINHRCFFYIKNSSIANRILFTGIIEY
jgi:hypothetical protein